MGLSCSTLETTTQFIKIQAVAITHSVKNQEADPKLMLMNSIKLPASCSNCQQHSLHGNIIKNITTNLPTTPGSNCTGSRSQQEKLILIFMQGYHHRKWSVLHLHSLKLPCFWQCQKLRSLRLQVMLLASDVSPAVNQFQTTNAH